MNQTVLDVKNLKTEFITDKKAFPIIKDVNFTLERGKVLGIVGESGCGKSVTVNTVLNLLPKNGRIAEGEITYFDEDKPIELQKLKQYGKEFRKLRGENISMIFQDPMSALNPVYTIGNQITEVLHEHYDISKEEANKRAIEMLEKLGIHNAAERMNDYPHQFSGGQRQRIVIAIAMVCNPDILIADEPTTALDVTIQAQILDLLDDLRKEHGTSIILITHDLGVIAQIADEVAVMYAGEVVEVGTVAQIFDQPKHPYTRSLLRSIPNPENMDKKLHVIQGSVPSISEISEKGCRFANRIPWLEKEHHEEEPQLHDLGDGHFVRCSCYKHFFFEDKEEETLAEKHVGNVVLEVKNIKKYYYPKKQLFKPLGSPLKALDDVSLELRKGTTIGIVGESGSGKSTIAKSLMKLHDITDGEINIDLNGKTQNIYGIKRKEDLDFRKKVQMVFQDPYASLNPTKKIYNSFDEPMIVHNIGNKEERFERMKEALKMVNVPVEYLERYPHEFSGGQRQRLCIARALCMKPEILILDEPVSALDLSVQAQVLNYLVEIQNKEDLTYVFISHDLGVVKYMCDYLYVIHKGRIVEAGSREDIYNNPMHIYTKKLLAAIPKVDYHFKEALATKRKENEVEFKAQYHEFYDEDGRAYDLKQVSPTHFVALKPE
ncbi:TPA: dipeptide ABC transporter ATP-binding protein [Streptococcus pneumoniae]